MTQEQREKAITKLACFQMDGEELEGSIIVLDGNGWGRLCRIDSYSVETGEIVAAHRGHLYRVPADTLTKFSHRSMQWRIWLHHELLTYAIPCIRKRD